jgi:predicted AAA+ superfamily ATPase
VSEILNSYETNIQNILYKGGWPELHSNQTKDPKKFLDDYINSYIEKDIVLAAGIQKSSDFLKFVKLLAGRVGELLDFSHFSKDVGVDSKTIKGWISILEQMHIIVLVPPYFSNLSSRLIKSPKVFFIDTGLACRLQGWTSAEPILTSPQQGHLFENLVFAELYKLNMNYQLGWSIYHWRSRDGEEVDFVVEQNNQRYLFIESKVTPSQARDLESFPELKKVFNKKITSRIICHQEGSQILGKKIPISFLKNYLLENII